MADRLLDSLQDEVNTFLSKDSASRAADVKRDGASVCPFCPRRTWDKTRSGRVVTHVKNHHTRAKQFVASGTKQLKLVIALHDQDQCERKAGGRYLARSAALMSAHLDDSVSSKDMTLDRHIRLVLTSRGPQYWSLATVQTSHLRRVRNLYYTHDFAQMLFKEFLVCDAKARAGSGEYIHGC